MRKIWVYIGAITPLVILWFYAGFPLLRPGFIPTHDGEYHIIRIYEFFNMLKAGYAFPRWAAGLNSGYGIPLFNFHYPFPNYIGSFFHTFGFSLVDSFKLTLFTGYIFAGVMCFLWLKKLFGLFAACVGTIVFSFVPYWFVDIYVRGSVGEVLALAFVMLSLACMENRRHLLLALAVAGLILSHNILAMLFVPMLFLYAWTRNRYAMRFMLLGIGMSVYFWLPALSEQHYMTGLNSVNFRDHFPELSQLLIPSWGTGFSASGSSFFEMSQQVGIAPILVFLTALIVVLRKGPSWEKKLVLFFLLAAGISFLLMLRFSLVIWQIIVPLQFLQYPWRLLSVVIPASGLLAAFAASKIRIPFGAIFAIIAIVVSIQYVQPVKYAVRQDSYYLSRTNFTDGTSSLGNSFSTIWTPWKQTRAAKKAEFIKGSGSIQTFYLQPLLYQFEISASTRSLVRIHTLYYPGWTVFVDGVQTPVDTTDGVINFSLEQGTHIVKVTFTETPLRFFADVVSIASLFWLVALGILKYIYARRP